MAFWKKKDNDSAPKCPLCSTIVSQDDNECPLCFYELKVSPRHQSLNITPNEEDSLIGLLNSDTEEEEEDIIREVEDVINLDAQEITVEAKYDDDDDEFISIPSEHAPEFITSKMTPQGVVETEPETKQEDFEEEEEEDLDLGGIVIPKPPSKSDVEYEELTETDEEDTESTPVENPAPVELPPPPAPVELPPPAIPPTPKVESPYAITPNEPPAPLPAKNNSLLTEGPIWPWPIEDDWDARDLRRELLEAMAAAKNGQNNKAEETLDRIGPHLGKNIDLIFHIGVLLKKIGRNYELMQMLTKAQAQYPEDPKVSDAISKLS